jgi:hypothetical protein
MLNPMIQKMHQDDYDYGNNNVEQSASYQADSCPVNQEMLASYETGLFITVFTRARQ